MKHTKQKDLFENLILTEEEQLLEQSLKEEEFIDDSNFEDTKAMLKEAAAKFLELNTSKPITIRVNQLDLIRVKAKAKLRQIPYQTLLGSLIHHYAEGKKDLSL